MIFPKMIYNYTVLVILVMMIIKGVFGECDLVLQEAALVGHLSSQHVAGRSGLGWIDN